VSNETTYALKPGRPEWLAKLQAGALEDFCGQGFPHKRLEQWRYTDLAKMAQRSEQYLSEDETNGSASVIYTDENSLRLVFRDGAFDAAASNLESANLSVRLLESALDEENLSSNLSAGASSLSRLNLAQMDTGAVIDINDNAVIQPPLHIVFDNTRARNIYPRIVVRAGKNASATIVEHHLGSAASNSIAVTDIDCADGANLTYQKVQEESAGAYHVAEQTIRLQRDATCNFLNIDLGAAIARNDLRIHLLQPGADASATGLFLVDGTRLADNHLYLAHEAPHCTANAHYAGVMADKGRGVFNGMIHVFKDAQKTDAALYNKNLLLSKGAEINTKPELEIYADDVKCAHGSTTGQLDPTSLFYLRARGIPERQARNMLIQSFAAEVFQHIATEELREHVRQAVENRLNELGAAIEIADGETG